MFNKINNIYLACIKAVSAAHHLLGLTSKQLAYMSNDVDTWCTKTNAVVKPC